MGVPVKWVFQLAALTGTRLGLIFESLLCCPLDNEKLVMDTGLLVVQFVVGVFLQTSVVSKPLGTNKLQFPHS